MCNVNRWNPLLSSTNPSIQRKQTFRREWIFGNKRNQVIEYFFNPTKIMVEIFRRSLTPPCLGLIKFGVMNPSAVGVKKNIPGSWPRGVGVQKSFRGHDPAGAGVENIFRGHDPAGAGVKNSFRGHDPGVGVQNNFRGHDPVGWGSKMFSGVMTPPGSTPTPGRPWWKCIPYFLNFLMQKPNLNPWN